MRTHPKGAKKSSAEVKNNLKNPPRRPIKGA